MNLFKEIKSTLLGLVLFGLGSTYFWSNVKTLNEVTFTESIVPACLILAGIVLMFATDKFIDFVLTIFKKKTQ